MKQLLKDNERKSGRCVHKIDEYYNQFQNNLEWIKKMRWYMKEKHKLELEKLKLSHRTWEKIGKKFEISETNPNLIRNEEVNTHHG